MLKMATMKASTDLVVNVLDALDTLGSREEPKDVISREIIVEVAKAHANGCPARATDIVRRVSHDTHLASHVTVHKRLKKLVEMNLVATTQNPTDGRAQLLYLAPAAQEKIRKLAQDIRQLCEKQYAFVTAILSFATPSWI